MIYRNSDCNSSSSSCKYSHKLPASLSRSSSSSLVWGHNLPGFSNHNNSGSSSNRILMGMLQEARLRTLVQVSSRSPLDSRGHRRAASTPFPHRHFSRKGPVLVLRHHSHKSMASVRVFNLSRQPSSSPS